MKSTDTLYRFTQGTPTEVLLAIYPPLNFLEIEVELETLEQETGCVYSFVDLCARLQVVVWTTGYEQLKDGELWVTGLISQYPVLEKYLKGERVPEGRVCSAEINAKYLERIYPNDVFVPV